MHGDENYDGGTSDFDHPGSSEHGAPGSDSPIFGQLMARPLQSYLSEQADAGLPGAEADPAATITDWNLPKLRLPPIEPEAPARSLTQSADNAWEITLDDGGRHSRDQHVGPHRHAAPDPAEPSASVEQTVPTEVPEAPPAPAIRLVFAEPTDVGTEGATEIAPTEIAPTEIAPTEIAPTEIAPTEIAPTEIAPTEIAPTEIAPAADPPAAVPTPAEADEYGQAIVSDALAQAGLVLSQAETNAEAIVAQARDEAYRHLEHARSESNAMRDQAAGVLADARLRAEEIDHITADRARQGHAAFAEEQAAHEKRLSAARTEHEETLRVTTDRATQEAEAMLAAARDEAERIRGAARQDAESARAQLAEQRAQTQKQTEQMLDETRQTVANELAEAREQTAWTKQTIDALIEAAEADAEKIRRTAATEAEAERQNASDDAAALIDAARVRVEEQAARSLREREKLYHQAADTLESAKSDAATIRQQAGDEAERILEQANDRSNAIEQASKRRLQEAETGARSVRESAAKDLSRVHEESREVRRLARDEAATSLAQARAEADELRSKARTILSEARAEVSVLTAHRDEITRQLGDLSGVIEALAVADRPDGLAALAGKVNQNGVFQNGATQHDVTESSDSTKHQQQETQSRTEVSTQ